MFSDESWWKQLRESFETSVLIIYRKVKRLNSTRLINKTIIWYYMDQYSKFLIERQYLLLHRISYLKKETVKTEDIKNWWPETWPSNWTQETGESGLVSTQGGHQPVHWSGFLIQFWVQVSRTSNPKIQTHSQMERRIFQGSTMGSLGMCGKPSKGF